MTPDRSRAAAASTEAAWPEDAVEVGRIADAWGIKGWVRIHAYSADAEALFGSRRWFLKASDEALPVKSFRSAAAPDNALHDPCGGTLRLRSRRSPAVSR